MRGYVAGGPDTGSRCCCQTGEQGQRGQLDGLMGGLMASWGGIEVGEGNNADETRSGGHYTKRKLAIYKRDVKQPYQLYIV